MFSGRKMFQANQTLLRSVLSCSLLFSSMTLAAPRTVDNNGEVTKTRVNGTTNNNRYATNSAVLTNASILRSVRVNKAQGGMMAVIELDGQAKFNYFTLPSPYRLVVDIQNVANATQPVIEVGDFGIKRIRVGKLEDMVRVVFDAEKQQPYEITSEGTQIKVAFGNPTAFAAKATTAPEIKTSATSAAQAKPISTPPPAKVTAAATKDSMASVNASTKTVTPTTPSNAAVKVAEAPKSIATATPKPMGENKVIATKQQAVTTPVANAPTPQAVKLPIATALKAKASRLKPQIENFTSKQLLAANDKINDVPPPPKPAPTPTVVPNTGSKLAKKGTLPTEVVKPAVTKNDKPVGSVVTATPQPIVPPTSVSVRPREISGPLPSQAKIFRASDYLRTDFQGEPINLDLRSSTSKTVDIRDFLRFISDTYKVNFVMDQSVKEVPITVTLQGIPWNRAMDAILKANRLGVKVDGDILRVLTADAITQEDRLFQEQVEARQKAGTLITKTIRLNYAPAQSAGGGGGAPGQSSAAVGASPGAASSSSSSSSSTGTSSSGLAGIIGSSLSPRGSIQADPRTNMLIIKDLPENVAAIEEIIKILDVPEPQVEIEARIVIANRNFARDLGVQLGAVAVNPSRAGIGYFGTLPQATSSTGTGGGTGTSTTPTGTTPYGVPTGVGGTTAPSGKLGASGANTVLSLTTGIFGTAQISAILSMNESKGNVKTISAPRITAQNNQKASIVNGVQIPVQTESNNTLTVSFVTAALSLEITPQITDSGYVNLRVVASNDSVNTSYSTSAAPGINKQMAQTTVLVPDGGTTIIGGINVDVESNSQQRTPGISSIPGLGELFKRRTVSRQTDEILFFITPRIYRPFGTPTVASPAMGQK